MRFKVQLYDIVILTYAIQIDFFGKSFLAEYFLAIIGAIGQVQRASNVDKEKLFPFIVWLFPFLALAIDLFHGSDLLKIFKAQALIWFTLLSALGLYQIVKSGISLERIASNLAISILIGSYLSPNIFQAGAPWKFQVSFPLTILIVCMLSKWTRNSYVGHKITKSVSVLAIYGFFSLYLGTRSLALVIFLTAGLFLQSLPKEKRGLSKQGLNTSSFGRRSTLMKFLILFIVSAGTYSLYTEMASQGYMGRAEQKKFISQTANDQNLLVTGRPELVYSIVAIQSNPVFGYGSYPDGNSELLHKWLEFFSKYEIRLPYQNQLILYGDKIPIHSTILQFWIWYGLLGLVWPIYLLSKFFRGAAIVSISLLTRFLIVLGLWNLLFTPYGLNARIVAALTLVAIKSESVNSKNG